MDVNAALRAVPLFSMLSDTDLQALTSQARKHVYPNRQQIIWRGEPGDTMYIILSGRVKVHSATESGSEVTLAVLGPREYFGELSLLDSRPRSADVTDVVATECMLLSGAALQETMRQHSDIGWGLLQHLARIIRDQNANIETFASRDVTGRVALLLLRLAEQHGVSWSGIIGNSASQGVRLSIPLTRTDIATFVGATREHVTNIVNGLTRTGTIATEPVSGHIVILRPERLKSRAQVEPTAP